MRCDWQGYLNILPLWMRRDVDNLGSQTLQELRLRTGLPPELIRVNGPATLQRTVTVQDLLFVVNCASQYSPWTASTMAQGYITAPGGHRVGICGTAIMEHTHMRGIREPSSLCIRVSRDFPGIGAKPELLTGSMLIIGPPGSGKTTLLRDVIRYRSENQPGSIAVVDERGELFPIVHGVPAFAPGRRTDILRFCGKPEGILSVLKTMGPACIAVDEITEEADCQALEQALWCGTSILATAHAACAADLLSRPVYQALVKSKLFERLLVMQPDKTWRLERMPQ